jgi:hypothetical protein
MSFGGMLTGGGEETSALEGEGIGAEVEPSNTTTETAEVSTLLTQE